MSHTQRKYGLIIAELVTLPIVLLIFAERFHSPSPTVTFVADSARDFRRLGSLKAMKNLPIEKQPYTRTFANGEWIAVQMEHSCCSGAGFNATVIYDSKGHLSFDTTRAFCGYEDMASEFSRIKAGSLKDFYRKVPGMRLHKWEEAREGGEQKSVPRPTL
jgi:hypothetical protein